MKARSFKLCLMINSIVCYLSVHAILGDLDLFSRSQLCQKGQSHSCLFLVSSDLIKFSFCAVVPCYRHSDQAQHFFKLLWHVFKGDNWHVSSAKTLLMLSQVLFTWDLSLLDDNLIGLHSFCPVWVIFSHFQDHAQESLNKLMKSKMLIKLVSCCCCWKDYSIS